MRLLLVLVCSILFMLSQAIAAPLYTVKDIEVAASGDNATDAKKEAVSRGEKQALLEVMKRIVPMSQHVDLPLLEDAQASALVQSIEIKEEKVTANRYRAILDISFTPHLVKQLLSSFDIATNDSQAEPVIIIPVFYDNNDMLLWNDTNSWQSVWHEVSKTSSVIPLVLPQNHTDDFTNISVESLLLGEYAPETDMQLLPLIDRFKASKILLVEARYSSNRETGKVFVQVGTTELNQQGKVSKNVNNYAGSQDASLRDTLLLAAKSMIAREESYWREQSVVAKSDQTRIGVIVPISSLQDWNENKKRIEGLEFISDVVLTQLSVNQASLNLTFKGGYEMLFDRLLQAGFFIENDGANLVLRPFNISNNDSTINLPQW